MDAQTSYFISVVWGFSFPHYRWGQSSIIIEGGRKTNSKMTITHMHSLSLSFKTYMHMHLCTHTQTPTHTHTHAHKASPRFSLVLLMVEGPVNSWGKKTNKNKKTKKKKQWILHKATKIYIYSNTQLFTVFGHMHMYFYSVKLGWCTSLSPVRMHCCST